MSRRRKAIILILFSFAGLLPLSYVIAAPAHGMTRFSSYWDMKHFLAANGCDSYTENNYGMLGSSGRLTPAQYSRQSNLNGLDSSGAGVSNPVPQHSGTNDQVVGVDEPDTVKNDGRYVYLVTNNTLVIVDAYPAANARISSVIHVNGTIQGIFIDGNSLAVLQDTSPYARQTGMTQFTGSTQEVASNYPYWAPQMTSSVLLFDSTDKGHLVLKTSLRVNGAYVDARLIDHVIYMIATNPSLTPINTAQTLTSEKTSVISTSATSCSIILPEMSVNGKIFQIMPEQVYHSDIQDSAGQAFTSVISINTTRPSETASVDTFLVGTSSTIYASLRNIFLTSPNRNYGEETVIHRLSLENGRVGYAGTGSVPGRPLNQFSMDEYQDHLRIATANSALQRAGSWWSGQGTSIYVLDKNLKTVGSLEGLSSGELFYSARFMADRAYLVTYRQTDPLFVVDLKDPAKPRVLGQLNIDGYSNYLQAYDQNHLIGIGKMAAHTEAKVSLFNVTDPSKPTELARYIIGSGSSESQASFDHKAVLLDPGLNLLVIPASTDQLYQSWQPSSNVTNCSYWQNQWQGVYVLDVTNVSITLRGTITHGSSQSSCSPPAITRELYIGNVLYTISIMMIKMNSLNDLHEVNSVNL